MSLFKNESILASKFVLPEGVSLGVSRTPSDAQKAAGIVGKGFIHHPAFNTALTLIRTATGVFVREQQQSRTVRDKVQFDAVCLLKNEIRELVAERYATDVPDSNGPWYLKLLNTTGPVITSEASNPGLDILNITLDRATANMNANGILSTISVETSIATLKEITVSFSAYDDTLQLREPAQERDNRNTRLGPCFRLTQEAKAQILNFLHANIDWAKVAEMRPALQGRIQDRQEKSRLDAEAKAASMAAAAAEVDEATEELESLPFGSPVEEDEELPS